MTKDDFYSLYFDGGSSPSNPGPTAGAFVIFDKNGLIVYQGGKFVGKNSTNNVGEYTGLITGLEMCVKNGLKNILIHGDSTLVIKQVSGLWKINFDHLKVLCKDCLRLISLLDNVGCCWIQRNLNKDADRLSDEIIKENKFN
jgi:ribonuclease HI